MEQFTIKWMGRIGRFPMESDLEHLAAKLAVMDLDQTDVSFDYSVQKAEPRGTPWEELSRLELELEKAVHAVAQSLDALNSTAENVEERALEQLARGMKKIEEDLTHIKTITTRETREKELRDAMIERYAGVVGGIQQACDTIRAREAPRSAPHKYSNRTSQPVHSFVSFMA